MDTNTLEVKISSANAQRRGITLIESVLAAAILAMAVMAVFSAIGAGTSHAQESARRIAGTMASEALLARVLINDGTDLEAWDGFSEPPGDLRDANHVLLAPFLAPYHPTRGHSYRSASFMVKYAATVASATILYHLVRTQQVLLDNVW